MIDLSNQMMYRLGNLDVESQRISYQMASGKILDNGSDDSVLYGRYLGVEDDLRVHEGLKAQIDKTIANNNVADSSINEMKTGLEQVKIELLKSLNAGMARSDKNAVATSIEGIRETLITLSNTQVDGEFLFTGSNTTKTTYSKDDNFTTNGKVDFGGNAHLRDIAVTPGTYRDRGVTAHDVLMYNTDTSASDGAISFKDRETVVDQSGNTWKFIDNDNVDSDSDITTGIDTNRLYKMKEDGTASTEYMNVTSDGATPPTYTSETIADAKTAGRITTNTASGMLLESKRNVFDELNIMINALKGYATNDDGTKGAIIDDEQVRKTLSTSLNEMSLQYDATNIGHAELGARNKIFDTSLESLTSKITHYNILMQETNGADMGKLAMESKSLELTYQALYSTIAKMNSLSLVNFLR